MFQTANQLLSLHLNIYITTVDHDNLFSSSGTGEPKDLVADCQTLTPINPHDGRQTQRKVEVPLTF